MRGLRYLGNVHEQGAPRTLRLLPPVYSKQAQAPGQPLLAAYSQMPHVGGLGDFASGIGSDAPEDAQQGEILARQGDILGALLIEHQMSGEALAQLQQFQEQQKTFAKVALGIGGLLAFTAVVGFLAYRQGSNQE